MLDNVIVSNVITYLRVMVTFQTALMFISISLYRFGCIVYYSKSLFKTNKLDYLMYDESMDSCFFAYVDNYATECSSRYPLIKSKS